MFFILTIGALIILIVSSFGGLSDAASISLAIIYAAMILYDVLDNIKNKLDDIRRRLEH